MSFVDAAVRIITEEPGLTAREYARILLDRGLISSSAQDPVTSFVATLGSSVASGRERRIVRRQEGGIYRYYPLSEQASSFPAFGFHRTRRRATTRSEPWEISAFRALEAHGGEASATEILRWVQDNRPGLVRGWQKRVLDALIAHSDGNGQAYFESVPGREARWRLSGVIASIPSRDAASVLKVEFPDHEQLRSLRRIITKALANPGGSGLSSLEQYLLAIILYELDQHDHALQLLEQSLALGLDEPYRSKADRLRQICTMKAQT